MFSIERMSLVEPGSVITDHMRQWHHSFSPIILILFRIPRPYIAGSIELVIGMMDNNGVDMQTRLNNISLILRLPPGVN